MMTRIFRIAGGILWLPLFFASMVFAIALLTGVSSASGGNDRPAAQSDPAAIIGSNVEMHVQNPLEVVHQWALITFSSDGMPVKVWPGQKIAGGLLKITNVSSFDYAVYIAVEPMEVIGDSYPSFDIEIAHDGPYSQWRPIVVRSGITTEFGVTVKISYGSSASVFRGLNVYVNAGPPPAPEQISTSGCSAAGCG